MFGSCPLYATGDAMDWHRFAKIVSELRAASDACWPDDYGEHIYNELFRIAHLQFPWQIRMNGRYVSRYLRVYDHEQLSRVVREQVGMNYSTILRFAFAMYGHFIEKSRILRWPPELTDIEISLDEANRIAEITSTTFEECCNHYNQNSELDVNFQYRRSIFQKKPLIRHEGVDGSIYYTCPIPRYFLERLTDGLQLDIGGHRHFRDAWGRGVQGHLELLFERSSPSSVTCKKEREYHIGGNRWDTLDLLLQDKTADVFVECKSRRVSERAKQDLSDPEMHNREFDKLAQDIAKSYKNLNNGFNGHYPHWTPNQKPVYLVIAFLTDWFVFGQVGHRNLATYTLDRVREKLEEQAVDPDIVDRVPLVTASFDECELLLAALQDHSLNAVFSLKTSSEHSGTLLRSFLMSSFAESIAENLEAIADIDQFVAELEYPGTAD